MRDLEPMGDLIGRALQGLGFEHLDLIMALHEDWPEAAPDPWNRHARPVLVRSGELLVEASSPGAVSLLRYAVGDLLRWLDGRLGEGVVSTVRVQGPGAGRAPVPTPPETR